MKYTIDSAEKRTLKAVLTRNYATATILGGLLVLSSLSSGQTARSEEEMNEEAVVMTPFTVSADESRGYMATSTLAGTRLKTDLKDLGSSIAVATLEFMDDIAATDGESLLSYIGNIEVGGMQGNFSGATNTANGRYLNTEGRTNPQNNQRIRGLGSADLTRGLFLTDIPFDAYNSDRVTVSRGPNSLLFGIGSPGGVIDNSIKRPVLRRNFGEVVFRADSHGSLRSQFDLNGSVGERLALRMAGLRSDTKYSQKPAWNRDERIFASVEAVLAKNERSRILGPTLLKGNFEKGSIVGSPVQVIPPSVAYTGWLEPTPVSITQFSGISPESLAVHPSEGGSWQFQATYNPFTIGPQSDVKTPTHQAIFRQTAVVYSQANASEASVGTPDGLQGYTGVIPWNANLDTLASTGLFGTPGTAGLPGSARRAATTEWHTNSPYAKPYGLGFAVPTLQNTQIFDYRRRVFSGNLDYADRRLRAMNVAIEQGLFRNKMGFEIAYDDQRYETYTDYLFANGTGNSSGGPYDISVSIAEYLQNGQVNPNLGRAYTRVSRLSVEGQRTDRNAMRATAFGTLDLRGKSNWLRHLGNHRFTVMAGRDKKLTRNRTWRDGWISDDFDIDAAYEGNLGNLDRRQVAVMVFVSDSLLGVPSMDAVRLQQINTPRPQPGDRFKIFYANTFPGSTSRYIQSGTVEVKRYLSGESYQKSVINSRALAWQSYCIDDHIVGLLGFRRDDTQNYATAPQSEVGFSPVLSDGSRNPDFARLSSEPALVQSGDTTTWSAVVRAPDRFLPRFAAGRGLQVHVAGSENFNPVGIRSDALGRSIGVPTGTTREYGISMILPNNRMSVRLNWFRSDLRDIDASPNVNVASHAAGVINSYREGELRGVPFTDQLTTVANPQGFPIQNYEAFYAAVENAIPGALSAVVSPRYVDTSGDGLWDRFEFDPIVNLRSTKDLVADGVEVEVVANIRSNWRLSFNASKQVSVQSNTAQVTGEVMEAYNNAMVSSRAIELRNDGTGVTVLRPISELWMLGPVTNLRTARALDGTVSNEEREWRLTGVTNYDIEGGRLKGVGVGGALRWESRAATGYPTFLDPETRVPVADVTRPFYDDGLFSGDLWVSYAKRIYGDRILWKVQLNCRNLIGASDDIPVKTNPDGQVAVIRIPNPRTWYLSSSFKF